MKMVEDKWCGVEVVAAAAWTGGGGCVGSGDDDVVVYDLNGDRSRWCCRSGLDRDGGDRCGVAARWEETRRPRRKNIPVAGNAMGAPDNFLKRVCVLGIILKNLLDRVRICATVSNRKRLK
ncbi:hypothetical protein Tco_0890589 [Tanacetum coccineum]|uniref:Uncharacterized protein n=1 Tax=Tanacetum coccineum TaxID=301880 RepID=A0ABQ5C3T4_9ASTR